MGILCSDNAKINMVFWGINSFSKIFAGKDCVISITTDGRVRQIVSNSDIAERTEYWTGIQEIAISKWASGVAIGLVRNGTCMIAERPLRDRGWDVNRIYSEVKTWNNIKQVAASDAFFALDNSGCVHYVSFTPNEDATYAAVKEWRNIVRLIPGSQNSIFGIMSDGRVVATGLNCIKGPMGNINNRLKALNDIIDLYPTGSECEEVVLLHSDGKLSSISTRNIHIDSNVRFKRLDGFFWYYVVGLTTDNQLIYIMDEKGYNEPGTHVFSDQVKDSFAVDGDGTVFAIKY